MAASVVGLLAVVGVGWGTASPAGAAAWDPFPTATLMVTTQFVDFLDRAPTTTESSTWVTRLTTGTHARYDLVASLRASTDNTFYVDPIVRLYLTALVRPPDLAGFNHWVGQRRTGAKTPQQVADHFVTTTEYATHYGGLTNTQFVNELYLNVFGWAPGATDLSYWVGRLNTGESRASVLRAFKETPGAIAELQAEVNISVGVIAMFHRSPTGSDISTHGSYGDYPEFLAEVFFQHADYHYP